VEIAEPVLPTFCNLDPRKDRERSAIGGELQPGFLRLAMAIQTPQQAGPFCRGPRDRPTQVAARGIGGEP
jgi:hypothetical protein